MFGTDFYTPTRSGPNSGSLAITYSSGPNVFRFNYGTNLTDAENATWAATNGQWLHLVGVGTATSQTLYVNGIMVSNVTGLVCGDIGQVTLMNIGRLAVSGYDDFDGRMDEVRIFNRALSATEVQQLYSYEYAVQFEPTISLLKVQPSFSNLIPGTNYQLQVSTNLSGIFTNYGSAFIATNFNMTYPQYFNVDDWNQLFFRLQESP